MSRLSHHDEQNQGSETFLRRWRLRPSHSSCRFRRPGLQTPATGRYAQRSRDGPCFVCAILAGERPHYEVYEDADTIAFLARPVTLLGYCIVAPKRHVEDWVRGMDEDEFLALQRVVRR